MRSPSIKQLIPRLFKDGVLPLALLLSLCASLVAAEPLQAPEVLVEEQLPLLGTIPVTAAPLRVIEVAGLPAGCMDAGAALRSVTGLKLTEFGSPGHGSVITLRGGGSQQVLVLRDGVPLSAAMGGGPDLSAIPLSSIERIEVYRGGMGAFFGSSAMSGAVNIVSAAPGAGEDRVEIGVGSLGANRQRYSHNRRGYRADFERFHSEGDYSYRSVNGLKRTRENNRAAREELSLAGEFGGGGYRVRHTSIRRGEPGIAEFPSLEAESESVLTGLDVNLGQGALPRGWSARAHVSARDFSFEDPDPWLGDPIDTEQDYLDVGIDAGREMLVGETDILTAGFAVRREILDDAAYDDPARTTLKVRASWERFAAGGTWTAGVLGESAGDYGEDLAWRLGWEGPLKGKVEAFASLARGFRIPAFGELYYPEQGFMGGNESLSAESSYDAQLGFRLRKGALRGELTVFRTRYAESILFVPVSAYRIAPINTGAARVDGVELELAREGGRLQLGGSFAWQDPRLLATGERLIGRSRLKGSAWLSGRAFGGDWRLTHDYESRLFTDMFANQSVKPKHSTSIFLKREFGDWSLSAEGRNLFNSNLRDSRDLPLPGRTFFISVNKEL